VADNTLRAAASSCSPTVALTSASPATLTH